MERGFFVESTLTRTSLSQTRTSHLLSMKRHLCFTGETNMIRTLACTTLIATSTAFASTGKQMVGPPAKHPGNLPQYLGDKIVLGDREFPTWESYAKHLARENVVHKCGMTPQGPALGGIAGLGGQNDCARNFTNQDEAYDPEVTPIMQIRTVVHVIRTDDGQVGNVPIAQVLRAIEILNEDFRATPGTFGENGTDSRIEFKLAQFDPNGNITNGINYHNNSDWFADWGSGSQETPYAESIAWNPSRFFNIYINDGGQFTIGYASIPQYEGSPEAGSIHDRIVLRWDCVGENAPIGEPRERGHLITHEVGHYLGLWHVFQNWEGDDVCGGNCTRIGDAVCDTRPQNNSGRNCDPTTTCGHDPNTDNYMDYSDDVCRGRFTIGQIRRMRCTLMNWRPDIYEFAESRCSDICPGDLDLDNRIDGADLGVMFASWGDCPAGDCCADLDGNQMVDGADLGILFSRWGECRLCPEGWEQDCVGNCFPSWLVNEWKGDTICDDGSFIPANHGCQECPPETPIHLDCETFGWDDGDCPIP